MCYHPKIDQITNVAFRIKNKKELPKTFNTYVNDTDVKNFGIDDKPKGWFGGWFGY